MAFWFVKQQTVKLTGENPIRSATNTASKIKLKPFEIYII